MKKRKWYVVCPIADYDFGMTGPGEPHFVFADRKSAERFVKRAGPGFDRLGWEIYEVEEGPEKWVARGHRGNHE